MSTGYLLETKIGLPVPQTVWSRIESDDRTTDLLGADAPSEESVAGRVHAYSGSHAHRILKSDWKFLELGAQCTLHALPAQLLALYGGYPL